MIKCVSKIDRGHIAHFGVASLRPGTAALPACLMTIFQCKDHWSLALVCTASLQNGSLVISCQNTPFLPKIFSLERARRFLSGGPLSWLLLRVLVGFMYKNEDDWTAKEMNSF